MTTEQRLAKLERRCRVLIGMLIAVGGMFCLAAAAPPKTSTAEELTVRRLVVVDRAGKRKIVLDGEFAGGASISVLDPAGNVRATLAATNEDAGLVLLDTKRRSRIALNTDAAGQGEIILTDTAENRRAVLYTRETQAGITLHGGEKEPAMILMNTGTHGLVGYGDITRGEGFILGYNYQKRSGILKVGERRLVTAE